MSKQIELGTLVIVVLKARNLHDKHSFYKQDVYARLSLNGTDQNTPVDVKGGQHPVWDAEIRLPVLKDSGEKYRTLEVSCWAKENREDDLKGTGKVDISETLRTGEFDDWVGLEMNGAHRGQLYLEMTYYAAAPAPLTRRPSKLRPSERVARLPNTPPTSSPLSHRPQDVSASPKGTHLLPPSPASSQSSSASSSPRIRTHQLSTLLEEPPSDKLPKSVPSILRPGNPQSSPLPLSRPPPPAYTPYPSNSPTSYYNPNQANPGHSSTPRPAYPAVSVPEQWQTPQATAPPDQFSFPVPATPRARHESSGYNSGHGPPVGQAVDPRLPDPHIASRYAAPPPFPGTPQRVHAPPADNHGPAYRQRTSDHAQDERRRRALLAEEEAAARRKAQEDQDLEFARQLDRELNLESVPERQGRSADVRNMPGGW